MKFFTNSCFLLALSLLVFSCRDKPGNVIKVETEEVSLKLQTSRLDHELFDNASSLRELQEWHYKKLASSDPFYPIYLGPIMRIEMDTAAAEHLYRFAGNTEWKLLQQDIDSLFKDITPYNRQLEEAFKRFKVVLPQKATPAIYYFNSGFNVGIWPDTNLIGIGLEWYLGPGNKIVRSLPLQGFPQYKRDNMQPYYMVTDAIKGWLLVNFFKNEYTANLLDYIVFYGKVLYATDAALPEVADSVKMNYTSRQMEWCYKNEGNIWKEMVKQDLIFTTKERELIRFTGEGPFTNGFTQESAPRLGVFMGWQMVADYMEKNPRTPLSDLMNKVPARQVLKAYKPRK